MTRNWCNMVLVALSALSKLLKAYDIAFKARLDSGFGSVHLKSGVSTLTLYEEMIEINARKHRLLMLERLANAALDALPEREKRVLVMRFLDGITFQEIALAEDISLRTAFRRFDRARESFCRLLESLGLDEKTFMREYASDPALKAVCTRLECERFTVADGTR